MQFKPATCVTIAAVLAACGPTEVAITIPPFVPDQPLASEVTPWEHGIAAFISWGQFYSDPNEGSLRPLMISGCDRLLSLVQIDGRQLALCETSTGASVLEERRGEWTSGSFVPLAIDEFGARLVTSGARIAVVSGSEILYRGLDREWQRIAFSAVTELAVKGPPQHAILSRYGLWLGYDHTHLVVPSDDGIYVATNRLGILEVLLGRTPPRVRQMRFPRSDTNVEVGG